MKESKNLYKSLMDASPDAVILVGLNSKIIHASKQALEMFKTTKENFIGKNAFDFIMQKDKKIVMTHFKKVINEEFVCGAEYKILLGDNTTIIGETNGVCIKDIDGNKTGILTTIRDITKRKKMELELLNSKMHYKTIIENSNDMIWTLDNKGKFIFFNKRSEQISGYTFKELNGKSFEPLLDKKDLPRIYEIFKKTLQGKPQQYEISVKRKDQSIFILSVTTAPLYSNGILIGTTSFGRNITQKKKTEKNLNETKNYLETIINMSCEGIFVVDEKGNFEFGNPACTDICGWQPHEMIGKPFIKLIPPKYHEFILERWMEAQNNKAKPYETVIITKNGEEKHISVSHRAIEFNGQRKYVDVIKDITMRKKMDAQKEFLEKIIENCTDAIISIDMSYLVSSWNPAAEKLLGFKKEEAMGKNVLKHLVPNELKLEREKLIYEASKNGSASIKTKRYTKDHTLVSVILTISPIYDNNGQLMGYSIILKDLQSIQNNSDI